MIKTGLCSVTFRQLSAEQVIKLVEQAGLQGIEWGGDIHVPPGNLERASEVARQTTQAGLYIPSYGSYYRAGCEGEQSASFEQVLQTAISLGAPAVRIWAGDRGSKDADHQHWERVIQDAQRIASMAKKSGITLHFEYHDGTLTDTPSAASRLMKAVDRENVKAYWQPPVGENIVGCLNGMNEIRPWLSHAHVFHWKGRERRPLSEGEEEWTSYLKALSELDGEHYAMLEFVRHDDPEQFLRDAKFFQILIDRCGRNPDE